MDHPERLTKLFAFGANYNPAGLKDISASATFNAYIEGCGQDCARMSPTPKEYDAFVQQISQMWATQPEQLAKITVPTMIADGEHDEGIKREHTEELAKLIPGAKLVILPGWRSPFPPSP
jgi:pimeloyl-ACP methyl ester carboxylesterase